MSSDTGLEFMVYSVTLPISIGLTKDETDFCDLPLSDDEVLIYSGSVTNDTVDSCKSRPPIIIISSLRRLSVLLTGSFVVLSSIMVFTNILIISKHCCSINSELVGKSMITGYPP